MFPWWFSVKVDNVVNCHSLEETRAKSHTLRDENLLMAPESAPSSLWNTFPQEASHCPLKLFLILGHTFLSLFIVVKLHLLPKSPPAPKLENEVNYCNSLKVSIFKSIIQNRFVGFSKIFAHFHVIFELFIELQSMNTDGNIFSWIGSRIQHNYLLSGNLASEMCMLRIVDSECCIPQSFISSNFLSS